MELENSLHSSTTLILVDLNNLIKNHVTAKSSDLGPDLQNILRQSYDYLTIMLKLRSTYDERLIYKTSYEEHKAFLTYDLLAKVERSSEIMFVLLAYDIPKRNLSML